MDQAVTRVGSTAGKGGGAVKHLELYKVYAGPFVFLAGQYKRWKYRSKLARFWRTLAKDRIEGRRVVVR